MLDDEYYRIGKERLGFEHPQFESHFTHRIYNDPGDDFAPFGSDEGSDVLARWTRRRDELTTASRVRDLYESDEEWNDAVLAVESSFDDAIEEAILILAHAFTLLRLTGYIDPEGRQAALQSIDRILLDTDNAPEYLQQKFDLESWQNPAPSTEQCP
ncbi:hypothetical protein [Dermacoccus sp. Tok2021]|uniref:hypothetical protein n=1 Tax=Dermacoccus sp. Tok2021 TaxID=2826873 RepID=UPI001CA72106|nr:hypothetical protein [Dermacoccus sp. Tok2021]MBZ4498603.1 hypothetical protein [Dermacoccus sp. Tok2021]